MLQIPCRGFVLWWIFDSYQDKHSALRSAIKIKQVFSFKEKTFEMKPSLSSNMSESEAFYEQIVQMPWQAQTSLFHVTHSQTLAPGVISVELI